MAEKTFIPASRLSLQNLIGIPTILENIVGYLRYSEICQLEATCREINHELTRNARITYKRIDLANPQGRSAKPLPLRNLQDKRIAQHVRTLILDGNDPSLLGPKLEYGYDIFPNLRLLSCLEMPRGYAHLMSTVASHLDGHEHDSTYTLAVYYFSHADWSQYSYLERFKTRIDVDKETPKFGDSWYEKGPRLYAPLISIGGPPLRMWDVSLASLLSRYGSKIAFDIVTCPSPVHLADTNNMQEAAADPDHFFSEAIAKVPIGPDGCHDCHSVSEKVPWHGVDDASPRLPLLLPVPRFGTSFGIVKRCATDFGASKEKIPLHVRCTDCVKNRRCLSCWAFYCESCFPNADDVLKYRMQKLCKDCGPLCASCNGERQKTWKCGSQYCGEHADGCATGECDVCFTTTKFEELSWL